MSGRRMLHPEARQAEVLARVRPAYPPVRTFILVLWEKKGPVRRWPYPSYEEAKRVGREQARTRLYDKIWVFMETEEDRLKRASSSPPSDGGEHFAAIEAGA